MESIRHKVVRIAVHNRWFTLGLALLITAVFGYGLLKVEARTIFSDLFPKTHPFVQALSPMNCQQPPPLDASSSA